MIAQQNRHPAVLGIIVCDLVMAAVSLWIALLTRANLLPYISSVWTAGFPVRSHFATLSLGSFPVLLGALYLANAYDIGHLRTIRQICLSVIRAALLSTLGVFAFAYTLRDWTFSRAVVAVFLLVATSAFIVVRIAFREWLFLLNTRGDASARTLIIGTGPAARAIADSLSRRPYLGYRIAGFIQVPGEEDHGADLAVVGTIDALASIVDQQVVDAVVFATSLEQTARYEKLIWKLEEVGKTVHMRGDAIGVLLSRTYIGEFDGMPMLTLRSTPSDAIALALKRATDLAGSALGLILLAPLFAVTAALVKWTSRGPVFYTQERVGLSGRRFGMIKFRSMYTDAERRRAELDAQNEMTGPVFKMKNDPRITPVGKWIRRFSIDELPQLWNVLVGDMSLVGPRPPIPSEVDQYQRWQRRRLSMKPGLTCLWQVGGRNDLDFDTWMKLDMEYIDNWSLLLDLKILLKTIPVVLTARGAR